ncbi:hypothetical protein [Aeromonas sp. FDAARGOS 1407]|uniref:hypothetical protein n=1 Tax=Aeromonas TaxID=642 RepID=UPI001C245627|nr:hypothetical protein [Aeromonas sp. FDAARGOS 1407]QXC35584.1 hypothetical protein I6L37_08075 [Aeromonas sp. FDAARGOS 1407]
MGIGSILEGQSLEIGGLMQQDTGGDIEHLRKKTTNQQDDGIDYERIVKPNHDYFKYMRELKKGKRND